jgi:hypothetical protein
VQTQQPARNDADTLQRGAAGRSGQASTYASEVGQLVSAQAAQRPGIGKRSWSAYGEERNETDTKP